jgi:hypothetical protein
VNQVGASGGMNHAAPGIFVPDTFVRWAQDVLFDRVGLLRRRAPFKTIALLSEDGTLWAQPDGDKQRVIGLVATRNPKNENRFGIIVTDANTTRVLFYDDKYRKTCFCVIDTVREDAIVFSRPALDGGVFIGIFEDYGSSNAQNKHFLYYWRGGTGTGGYSKASCVMRTKYDDVTVAAAKTSNNRIELNNHGLNNGYAIQFTALGTVTGVSLNTTYFVINATTNDFQIAATPGGSAINLTGTDSNVSFIAVGHVTYTDIIDAPSGNNFDTSNFSHGMFVYRTSGSNDEVKHYLGILKDWATDGSNITLEKAALRTQGFNTSAYTNKTVNLEFVNIRPYVHNHGRGLITRQPHGFTVTSGSVGSLGEGHFKAAGLDPGTNNITGWALYRASDHAWLGDVASVTDNAALSLSGVYHSPDIPMNADEYVAYPYTPVSTSNTPTSYTGVFNTTYAGLQWFGNGGAPGTENRIVFSAYHNAESVDLSKDAADSVVIPGTQQMRGIATSSSGLLIFLEDKTYILRGNYRANFSLEELYPEGCLGAGSIVEYGGGVFWAAKNGILFYDGATVRNLTETNLGSYYTDSIKTFDASLRRIYAFLYKDYLFIQFTGLASAYNPVRYEPVYAESIEDTDAIKDFTIDDWDPDFTVDDFDPKNNTPIYWDYRSMYETEGIDAQNTTGFWEDGYSFSEATMSTTTVTGLTFSGVASDTGTPYTIDTSDISVGDIVLGENIPGPYWPTTSPNYQVDYVLVDSISITTSDEIELDTAVIASDTGTIHIVPAVPENIWSRDLQFVWGPANQIESMTFAIYLPTNALSVISNFDFKGFVKLDSVGGTLGFAAINAVDPIDQPDPLTRATGTYARLVDVDSMLSFNDEFDVSEDSELSENLGKNPILYYKGPDFYLQTKHYPVGDPVLRKWFRQVFLNLYLLDGGLRMDIVDNEDKDRIDVQKKRRRNWEVFGEAGYSWQLLEATTLPKLLSPKRSTWENVEAMKLSWYELADAEFERRKKKVSWRYPTAGFRLYQMNNYRPRNYQSSQRPHVVKVDSWNIGFKPMRTSRV